MQMRMLVITFILLLVFANTKSTNAFSGFDLKRLEQIEREQQQEAQGDEKKPDESKKTQKPEQNERKGIIKPDCAKDETNYYTIQESGNERIIFMGFLLRFKCVITK